MSVTGRLTVACEQPGLRILSLCPLEQVALGLVPLFAMKIWRLTA